MNPEPLHPDSPPREGYYWKFGTARDSNRPLASRPIIPVRVWWYELRDEVGDLLDDVKPMATFGDTSRTIDQDEWLHLAKHPISEDEYLDLYENGNWRDFTMHMPTNSGGDFTPPPAGTHIAICHRVIDLGTQVVEWQGKKKHQRKIMLSWEIPEEKMEDGRPFTVSKRYTLSSSDKSTLRHHLEAWRGKKFTDADFGPGGFDIKNVLKAPCVLGIVHQEKDGKTYANISALGKLPKGTIAPEPSNAALYFSLDEPNWEIYQALSDGLKQTIAASPEYQRLMGGAGEATGTNGPEAAGSHDDFGDDIPF